LIASTRVESLTSLNTGKKRSYDDALGPDQHIGRQPTAHNSSQTNASFSSLINYDPSSSAPAHSSPPPLSSPSSTSTDATVADAPPAPPTPMSTAAPTPQQRAEVLRVRLRMAMFRVRTNQLRVPLDGLLLPGPPSPDLPARQQEEGQRREKSAQLEGEAPPATPLSGCQTAATENASSTGGNHSLGGEAEGRTVGA
jgi:hypothetical protein